MTKPIEIIHQNFVIKIGILKDLYTLLESHEACRAAVAVDRARFDNLCRDYNDQTLMWLCEYFMTTDLKRKCQTVDRYMQVVVSQNYISKLNEFADALRDQHAVMDHLLHGGHNHSNGDAVSIQLKFKTFYNTPIDTDIKRSDYKVCPACSGRMNVHPQSSELRCTVCSCSIVLKGTVFDESHMYTSEGTLAKRGNYETSRHCRYHLERILAIKNPNIPQAVWDKIYAWLQRNNFQYHKLVNCPDLRRCFKEIHETKYNEYIPFVRQIISGISPERLFHHEMSTLHIYFEKAVTVFNRLKGGERVNLKYYPYFIFKIIEMILGRDEDRKRLHSIINCIHFQRDDTVVANDRLWNDICGYVREFEFKKTDRNLLYDTNL